MMQKVNHYENESCLVLLSSVLNDRKKVELPPDRIYRPDFDYDHATSGKMQNDILKSNNIVAEKTQQVKELIQSNNISKQESESKELLLKTQQETIQNFKKSGN